MKNYFYLFLFVTSFIIAEKESFLDITLAHLNPANKVVIKIAAKRQEQLKTLKQERKKHEQDLITINKSIEEIKKETAATDDKTEHELLQEVDQILHKIASVLKELISSFDAFIKEIELSLENISSLQLSTPHSAFSSNNMQQLTEIIVHNEKLIDQLTIQRNRIKTTLSFAHNNENSKSPHKKKLNSLKKKLIELQRKKYEIINFFIELLQKDLSLLKGIVQYTSSSPSIHESSKPTVHPLPRLLDYAKNSFSLSKVAAAFVSLIVGGRRIYKYATKKDKQEPVEDNRQTQKTEELEKEKTEQQSVQEKILTRIPQENFSHYYGPIPAEISNICKQLKADNSKNKQIEGPLPILLGPGKKFLIKCLAGELKVPFHFINFPNFLAHSFKNEENPIDNLAKIIKGLKKLNVKKSIIYLDQIDVISEFPSDTQDELFKVMKKEPNITIISSLNDSTLKQQFIKFKIIELSLPDKQTRKKVIEDKNLSNKLSIQAMKDLVVDTKGMEISHLQDTIEKLKKVAEKEESILIAQDIKKILGTKKTEIREELQQELQKKLQKTLPEEIEINCSWPKDGLGEYLGEIPDPLLKFIKKIETDDPNTCKPTRFLFSGPSGSGGEDLAQFIAGQFGAPFFKIPLREIAKRNNFLAGCIPELQKVGEKIQSKIIVIYIDGCMDSFIKPFYPLEQKIALENIAKVIKSIKNSNENIKVLVIGRLEKSERALKKAEKDGSPSILKELKGPDVFRRVINTPLPKEHHTKKILEKYSEEFGGFSEEVDIDNLVKKLRKRYPVYIRNFLHEARLFAEDRGDVRISPIDIQMVEEDLIKGKWSSSDLSPNQLKDSDLRLEGFAGTIPPEIKDLLKRLSCPKHFEKSGVGLHFKILLCGPPGTGKSFITKEVAKKFGCPFKSISGSQFAKKYIGEGGEEMEKVFDDEEETAKRDKDGPPPTLTFEEADVFLRKPDEDSKARTGMNATRSAFLTRMSKLDEDEEDRAKTKLLKWELLKNTQITPKIKEFLEKLLEKHTTTPQIKMLFKKQLEEDKIIPEARTLLEEQLEEQLEELGTSSIVFATTNEAAKNFDGASLRRFNFVIEMGYPSKETKRSILDLNLKNFQVDRSKINLDEFINQLEQTSSGKKTSGADLKEAVRLAAFEAAKNNGHIDNHYLNLGLEKVLKKQAAIKKGKSYI